MTEIRQSRGRKKREVTEEMVKDILLISREEYCEKHNCSEAYFNELYFHNVKPNSKDRETVVGRVIIDKNLLIEQGYDAYYSFLCDKHSKLDMSLSDIYHALQLKKLSPGEKIILADMIGEIRRERELYTSATNFAFQNKMLLKEYVNLMNKINAETKRLDSRKYNTRMLVDLLGETICCEKN